MFGLSEILYHLILRLLKIRNSKNELCLVCPIKTCVNNGQIGSASVCFANIVTVNIVSSYEK